MTPMVKPPASGSLDRTERSGSPGLVLVLALVLVGAAAALPGDVLLACTSGLCKGSMPVRAAGMPDPRGAGLVVKKKAAGIPPPSLASTNPTS